MVSSADRRRRHIAFVASVVLAVLLGAIATSYALRVRRPALVFVVVSGSRGVGFERNCRGQDKFLRSAPVFIVSEAEVGVVLDELSEWYWLREILGEKEPPGSLSDYVAQLVGVEQDGRRMVYLSFFPESDMRFVGDEGTNLDPKSEIVSACDGGPRFWRVLFNTQRGEFLEPSFNGP